MATTGVKIFFFFAAWRLKINVLLTLASGKRIMLVTMTKINKIKDVTAEYPARLPGLNTK